ncbi:hypothetical protein [Polymorphobacter multimanifer]|uniref:Uncharacterized protein n=1 Tax=Polymorphobacter multimanifer TaxID=1070431 RepID=A0A841L6K3_9SPHN|nr:hypothetical protein [Polymorphobacter multimanifer]MBB6228589.1 hypothetical protein [Polymorphobacter multimanifer]
MLKHLQDSAAKSGCSFTQEIEKRLELSRTNSVSPSSQPHDRLFEMLGVVLSDIEQLTGGEWYRTRDSLAMTQGAVFAAMRLFSRRPSTRFEPCFGAGNAFHSSAAWRTSVKSGADGDHAACPDSGS